MTNRTAADDPKLTPPLSMHHLSGGLCVLVGSNRLALLPFPGDSKALYFSILKNTPILSVFDGQRGVRVLGRNRFQDAAEMHDPVAPNFALSILSNGKTCLAHVQEMHWSGVSNALHEAGRGPEALMASRVRAQIRVCTARLEKLSIAYRTTLAIAAAEERSKVYGRLTANKYSDHIASEYRSLLNELYALRDALLVVAYRLLFKESAPFEMKKIKRRATDGNSKTARLINISMFDAAGDLMIDRMSLHRSIALHCIGTTNPHLGDMYMLKASRGPYGELPYLEFPLYDDIESMRAIEQGSSRGVLDRLPFEELEREVERFLNLPRHLDALEFSYDCYERLLRIGEALAEEIGIAPKIITLTDDDLLEATISDEHDERRSG
jgi:hypothetical protein